MQQDAELFGTIDRLSPSSSLGFCIKVILLNLEIR